MFRPMALRLDRHLVFVKGHIALDGLGPLLGLGIVPSGIFDFLAPHHQMVITGLALPGAGGVGCTGGEVVGVEGIGGEIIIAFHHLTAIAAGNHHIINKNLGHGICEKILQVRFLF